MRPRGHVTRVGAQEAENRSEGSGVIARSLANFTINRVSVGKAERDRVNSLALVSFHNFSRLWAIAVLCA